MFVSDCPTGVPRAAIFNSTNKNIKAKPWTGLAVAPKTSKLHKES